MFSLKYLTLLLGAVLLLSVSSSAEDVSVLSEDSAMHQALKEKEDENAGEKLGFTSFTNGSISTVVSGAGIVWLLLWGVVLTIITSAVLCYWVGCEYASSGRRFSDLVGLYVLE